jgi:CRISPR-associated protein Csm5
MRVKFKVITPIHIGSGEELNRFDYVLYEDGIGIIDKVNFNDRVKKDKKVFNDFLKASENLKDLVDFLEDEVLDEEVLTIIETNEKILEILERNYSRAINSFIKDKFLKKPIIPGSSVKGAIRTAILDYVVFYNKNLQRINNTFFLEKEVFGEIKEDILKALFVDDFKPINYKLKIISPLNRGRKDNPIPVLLEMVENGEFEGEIRIDENLLKSVKNKYFNLDFEFIKTALEFHYEKVLNYENKRFKTNKLNYQKFLIKIGQHAGAGSKSISNRQVFIKQLRKNLPYQTSIWVDEENYPIGWAEIEFK